ncbi:GTP-binding protein [Micromonospora sp. NPDC050397]|uniref:GTP-binding protein n=1 Tax=Micromonospora sp. NPDC050397 TaxID=3364279 RepID=UPI00384D4C0A
MIDQDEPDQDVREWRADTLRVAFVGEVDHGKSTLLGRILLDAGAMTPDRLNAPVLDGGLAFLLDGLAEERNGLFTLDTAQAVIEQDGRRLTLIDVPGHLELLKNMVTGASTADVGVVVVDCEQGIVPQTKRHMRILELLGVTTCVCAATKMDLVDYRSNVYDDLAATMAAVAAECGIQLVATVPVSAIDGTNITAPIPPGHPLSWYAGSHLVETLHAQGQRRAELARLRFAVQTVLNRGGSPLVVGRIESGLLRPGRELVDPRTGATCQVTSIERFGEPPLAVAGPGDSVGLRIDGTPPPSGAILAPGDEPLSLGDLWYARVLNVADRDLAGGERCEVRFASASVNGHIEGIDQRWESSTFEPCPDGQVIGFSEIAAIRIRLAEPVAADSLVDCPPVGRFMLCDAAGEAVGLGVIDRVAGGAPVTAEARVPR